MSSSSRIPLKPVPISTTAVSTVESGILPSAPSALVRDTNSANDYGSVYDDSSRLMSTYTPISLNTLPISVSNALGSTLIGGSINSQTGGTFISVSGSLDATTVAHGSNPNILKFTESSATAVNPFAMKAGNASRFGSAHGLSALTVGVPSAIVNQATPGNSTAMISNHAFTRQFVGQKNNPGGSAVSHLVQQQQQQHQGSTGTAIGTAKSQQLMVGGEPQKPQNLTIPDNFNLSPGFIKSPSDTIVSSQQDSQVAPATGASSVRSATAIAKQLYGSRMPPPATSAATGAITDSSVAPNLSPTTASSLSSGNTGLMSGANASSLSTVNSETSNGLLTPHNDINLSDVPTKQTFSQDSSLGGNQVGSVNSIKLAPSSKNLGATLNSRAVSSISTSGSQAAKQAAIHQPSAVLLPSTLASSGSQLTPGLVSASATGCSPNGATNIKVVMNALAFAGKTGSSTRSSNAVGSLGSIGAGLANLYGSLGEGPGGSGGGTPTAHQSIVSVMNYNRAGFASQSGGQSNTGQGSVANLRVGTTASVFGGSVPTPSTLGASRQADQMLMAGRRGDSTPGGPVAAAAAAAASSIINLNLTPSINSPQGTHSSFSNPNAAIKTWRESLQRGVATPAFYGGVTRTMRDSPSYGNRDSYDESTDTPGFSDGVSTNEQAEVFLERIKRVKQHGTTMMQNNRGNLNENYESITSDSKGETTEDASGDDHSAQVTTLHQSLSRDTTPGNSPLEESTYVSRGFQAAADRNRRQGTRLQPTQKGTRPQPNSSVISAAANPVPPPTLGVKAVQATSVSDPSLIANATFVPMTAVMQAGGAPSALDSSSGFLCPYDKFEISDVILRVKDILSRDQLRQKQLAKQLGFSGSTLSPMLKHKYRHTKDSHIQALRMWAYERDVQFVTGISTQAQFLGLTHETLSKELGVPLSEVTAWSSYTMSPHRRGDFESSIVTLFARLSAKLLRGDSIPTGAPHPALRKPQADRHIESGSSDESSGDEDDEDNDNLTGKEGRHHDHTRAKPSQTSESDESRRSQRLLGAMGFDTLGHAPGSDDSSSTSLGEKGQHDRITSEHSQQAAQHKDAGMQAVFPGTWHLVESTFPSIAKVLLPMVTSSLGDLSKYGYKSHLD